MKELLTVKNLSKSFGGIRAVSDIGLKVEEGQIVSIIGPNGAGKTTVFNLLSGFYSADEGEIIFDGKPVAGRHTYDFAPNGMVRTFQNLRLFKSMSVLENVLIGRQHVTRYTPLQMMFNTPKKRRMEQKDRAAAAELVAEMGMKDMLNVRCDGLPYGQQKKLELVRALATQPKLLMLDEPAAGLNPQESQELADFIFSIRDRGITILVIEHDMSLINKISDYIYVMNHGELLCEGTSDVVMNDEQVIEAYIGKGGAKRVSGN